MPRRKSPDPVALAVGNRIRQLRQERGLTAESIVFSGEVGSKGFLSDIENGLALPSLHTLSEIARYLGVELLDLLTFPWQDQRHELVDRTRFLSLGTLRKLAKELATGGPHHVASTKPRERIPPILLARDSRVRPKRKPTRTKRSPEA